MLKPDKIHIRLGTIIGGLASILALTYSPTGRFEMSMEVPTGMGW